MEPWRPASLYYCSAVSGRIWRQMRKSSVLPCAPVLKKSAKHSGYRGTQGNSLALVLSGIRQSFQAPPGKNLFELLQQRIVNQAVRG